MAIDTRRQEGLVDQSKLADANVLVIGCGAIGSQVVPILARAGVRRFTLADGDDVEDHNLNRQFFTPKHVGHNKAIAVESQMKALDPDLQIDVIPNYIKVEDFDYSKYTHVMFAADSLYLEGQVYRAIYDEDKQKKPLPVFVSPRMNGFEAVLFVRNDAANVVPTNINFASKPDKDYSKGATCTGAEAQTETKIPAIATTTTFLCALAAQAVILTAQGLPFKPYFQVNLRLFFTNEKLEVPV